MSLQEDTTSGHKGVDTTPVSTMCVRPQPKVSWSDWWKMLREPSACDGEQRACCVNKSQTTISNSSDARPAGDAGSGGVGICKRRPSYTLRKTTSITPAVTPRHAAVAAVVYIYAYHIYQHHFKRQKHHGPAAKYQLTAWLLLSVHSENDAEPCEMYTAPPYNG